LPNWLFVSRALFLSDQNPALLRYNEKALAVRSGDTQRLFCKILNA